MPLQLDAAPPEADIWVGEWRDLGLPDLYIFARGHMALCAVSGQFIVPLVRGQMSTEKAAPQLWSRAGPRATNMAK